MQQQTYSHNETNNVILYTNTNDLTFFLFFSLRKCPTNSNMTCTKTTKSPNKIRKEKWLGNGFLFLFRILVHRTHTLTLLLAFKANGTKKGMCVSLSTLKRNKLTSYPNHVVIFFRYSYMDVWRELYRKWMNKEKKNNIQYNMDWDTPFL